MPLEGQVMSPRFIGSFRLTPRVALATALIASLGLATEASADDRVTAMLRGGERVVGRLDGFAHGQIYLRLSQSEERKIPIGDVALIDLVGGAQGLPETELREARGDDHVLLTGGQLVKGRMVNFEFANPDNNTPQSTTVVFRAASGEERRVRLSDVGRLYLGRFPGAAPVDTSTPTSGGQAGAITVAGNQRWVSTGITVAREQQVTFAASGEVQLSPDRNDVATTAGSKLGRRLSGEPMPGALAGSLIGRVGNGRVFGIGNQAGPLSMPDAGVLYLGVNDDYVDDNQGTFSVTVTTQPTTGRSTGSRPGRIRRP
jgi:hypothetical protein